MFRNFPLFVFGLLATPSTDAFRVINPGSDAPKVVGLNLPPIDNLSIPQKNVKPKVQEDNDDIDNMSLNELKALLLDMDVGAVIPDRASLEEARDMVWDHVVQLSSEQSTSCCENFPFCGCSKLEMQVELSSKKSESCCENFPYCGCSKLELETVQLSSEQSTSCCENFPYCGCSKL